MTTIWNNDYARAFFKDHGYPEQYNDGLFAWLKDVYGVTNSSLPDLLARYLREYGDDFNMRVLGKSAVATKLIEPAATFTATTPTNGGSGTIVLTSAGTHGLTAARAVGASIYISAGTGWTAGFYPITAIDLDTTGVAITITGTFDAGMGSPTIALANTEVILATIAIPILSANSMFEYEASWSYTNSANAKLLRTRFGGTQVVSSSPTTTAAYSLRKIIANRGATNSQIVTTSISDGSLGSTTASYGSLSIDTSVSTSLTFTAQPSTANELVHLERYHVLLFP